VVHLSAAGRKDLLKDVFASLAPASHPLPPIPLAAAAPTTTSTTNNMLSVDDARPARRLSRSGGSGPRDEELALLERLCVERKCDDSLITLYSLLPVDQWTPPSHDPLATAEVPTPPSSSFEPKLNAHSASLVRAGVVFRARRRENLLRVNR
jgi:hypothetical protein